MRPWQVLALMSGAIIAIVMAFASVSYNATLGTSEPAFRWLPLVTNSALFSVLALAFDLGMIASVFGFLHWRQTNRIGAALCVALFVIASLFSVHAVRGYIALNLTGSLAPAARAADVYDSMKLELANDQSHLVQIRQKALEAGRKDRASFEHDAEQLVSKIHDTRSRLAQAENGHVVSPLAGMEWFLAVTLWFFNATCWTAWFGHGRKQVASAPRDTVADWFASCDLRAEALRGAVRRVSTVVLAAWSGRAGQVQLLRASRRARRPQVPRRPQRPDDVCDGWIARFWGARLDRATRSWALMI